MEAEWEGKTGKIIKCSKCSWTGLAGTHNCRPQPPTWDDKAHEVVYGRPHWTKDQVLLERVAQALQDAYRKGQEDQRARDAGVAKKDADLYSESIRIIESHNDDEFHCECDSEWDAYANKRVAAMRIEGAIRQLPLGEGK